MQISDEITAEGAGQRTAIYLWSRHRNPALAMGEIALKWVSAVKDCLAFGRKVQGIYYDWGLTYCAADRPGLVRLFEDVRRGRFDVVLIHSWRDLLIDRVELRDLTQELEDNGVLWDCVCPFKMLIELLKEK